MFRPALKNPAQKRTLRPLYANYQATPYGGFLDPSLNIDFDILPGTVMKRVYGEVFAPATNNTTDVPFGLSALFFAPKLEVNEVSSSGTGLFTVWVGGPQAVFEVLAPAFDTSATWPSETNTGNVKLTFNNHGLLTPVTTGSPKVIAELIDVPSPDKIVVRLLGQGVN